MDNHKNTHEPESIPAIWADTRAAGFNMASNPLVCSLLRTLAAAKPASQCLELGSGTGLSTTWMLDGMDAQSHLTTMDNDESLLAILKKHLGSDSRLIVTCDDGDDFVRSLRGQGLDFIFADTWAGKYRMLKETLALLNPAGVYVIDDMLHQASWPEGHDKKAVDLAVQLEQHDDFYITKLSWGGCFIIATRV